MLYANYVNQPLPEAVFDDVLSITEECASGLFLEPMDALHPFYDWRVATLIEEYAAYMGFTSPHHIPDVGRFSTGVIMATHPESGDGVGFILYSRDFLRDDTVGIVGIAVRESYRNQQVMTRMIAELRKSCTDIALSCYLSLAKVYYNLGFTPVGISGPQVLMRSGGPGGHMAVFGPGSFDKAPLVEKAETDVRNHLGRKIEQVQSDYKRDVASESAKVATFHQGWLAGSRVFP
jgi:GNAT superfamily N-acetyltransferase